MVSPLREWLAPAFFDPPQNNTYTYIHTQLFIIPILTVLILISYPSSYSLFLSTFQPPPSNIWTCPTQSLFLASFPLASGKHDVSCLLSVHRVDWRGAFLSDGLP